MNAGTLFVLLIVAAMAALAVRSIVKKRGCGCCDKGCEGCSQAKIYGINDGSASGCPHCANIHLPEPEDLPPAP